MTNAERGYKLLLRYDVQSESLQEYYKFMMEEYLQQMQAMGFQMSEAWHTAYGEVPNRLIGFVCSERQTLDELFDSERWRQLNEELDGYVTNFSYKVIPYRSGFQL